MSALSRSLLAPLSALMLAACGSGSTPQDDPGDIAGVLDVTSSFGPEFTVQKVPPTGVDPRLLAPQSLPQGVTFDPPDCATFAAGLAVPPDLKGNMAAVTAEGAGNRFITIAVETSAAVPITDPGPGCEKVAFAGPGARGLVEVAESPAIDGARTLGTRRVVQTMVNGKPAAGELYNYVASFGSYLVIVTANPLVLPNQPVGQVNTSRARDLLVAAVDDVRGS